METNKRPTGSEFTGEVFAYYGITMLTAIVTALTAGFAYPVMLCWKLKWQMEHTFIDGKKVAFKGDSAEFMGKYLRWNFLNIVTLGIYGWIFRPFYMNQWLTEQLGFEGEEGEARLEGSVGEFFMLRFVAGLLTVISFGFAHFWMVCKIQRWIADHTVIGGKKLVFDGKGGELFAKNIVWNLLTAVTLGFYLIWRPTSELKWFASHTHIA